MLVIMILTKQRKGNHLCLFLSPVSFLLFRSNSLEREAPGWDLKKETLGSLRSTPPDCNRGSEPVLHVAEARKGISLNGVKRPRNLETKKK